MPSIGDAVRASTVTDEHPSNLANNAYPATARLMFGAGSKMPPQNFGGSAMSLISGRTAALAKAPP